MPTQRNLLFLLVATCALQACVLGDPPATASPYDSAYFRPQETTQVADGISPITVEVHGAQGSTLTMELADAFFVTGDGELRREKTVQLMGLADTSEGLAEVQVVATSPGLATLSFKLAPLAASALLEFQPLEVRVGTPKPLRTQPGEVVHQLCVYAKSKRGRLKLSTAAGAITPGLIDLQDASDSECGREPAPWLGAASLEWSSASGQGQLEIEFVGPEQQVLLHSISEVRGPAFPGYWASLQGVEVTPQWSRVQAQIFYAESPGLESTSAGSVLLHDLRSVPPGIRHVGSSSGTAGALPQTDAEGVITLFFETPKGNVPMSVFATPEGGGTLFLGELSPPEN